MTPEQIEYLINQYDQRAEKALKDDNKSEWRRYSAQAKRLKKWRDEDGAADPCPVNYEEEGLTLEGATAAAPEKVEVENPFSTEPFSVKDENPFGPELLKTGFGNVSKTDSDSDEQVTPAEKPSKPAQTDRAGSLYNDANEAFKKEDWGKAKQLAGELARLGDSRGDEIIMAVDLRSGDGGGKVGAGTLQKIKNALRNRNTLNNVEILGNVVRDAEQIRARGQADENLLVLLEDARTRWDEMRKSHGQITTKGRLGNVEDRAESVADLNSLIDDENQLTVWDETLGAYRKTSDVLTEVQLLWEKKSNETADTELEEAQQDIPHRLDLAKERLEKAYSLPFYSRKERQKLPHERTPSGLAFHKSARNKIYTRLGEVKVMITQRDEAEKLRERARSATSPEQALNFLLDARGQWQHLEGLDQRITEYREDIAKLLVVKMQNKINEAEKALDIEDFDKASKALDNAREIKAAFPGEPLPALVDTLAKVEATEQVVRKRQTTAKKFAEQAKEIRGLLKDNNKYQLGIDLFETLKSEFADYPPLAKLGVEVSARKGPAEQWQEIQKLVTAEKWDDVASACSNLIHGGKGGDFAPQAKIILNKAQSELQIGQAKALLGQRHITDAENKFKEIIAKDKGRAPELQGYLDEIQTYKQNDKEAKKKMDSANKLRSSPNLEDQWLALQLYGDVADGDTSSYTVEASEKREALSASLREKLLAKIKNVSQLKTINPDSLKEAATCARILRQAQMEMDDGEKRLARALELKWLKQDAVKLSALGRWEEAAKKWQELEDSYPTDLDIQLESRLARKQRAIKEAESKINEEMNATAALEILKEEQTRGRWGGVDGELNWWLGEAYRLLKDFTNAERCAANAHRDPATQSKGEGLLQSIRDDRTITTVEEQVATQRRAKDYEAALEHIKRLDANLQKRHDVLKWRDDVLAEARKELLEIAKSEFRNNTTDSIAVAFEALARLNLIEKKAEAQESQADAASREKLPQWPNIARSVATRAAVFKPAHLPLVNAGDQAKRLLNQLEAFDLYGQKLIDDGVNAIDRFDKIGQRSAAEQEQRRRVEDWVENIRDIRGSLQEEIKRARNYDQRLGEIKMWMSKIVETSAQMEQYSDRVAWQIAVRENDFRPMSNIVQNILTIAGNDAKVPEVQNLHERLEETKELCAILRQQFNHIMYGDGNLFIAAENFAECARVCKELQNPPPREDPAAKGRLQQLTYASTGKTAPLRSWQAIKDIADYQRILRWLDPELDFNDSFLGMKISQMTAIKDGELNLEKIGRLAERRKADLEKWEVWIKDGERLHKAAKDARDNAELGGHQGAVRLRRAWAAAIPPLAKAETYFSRDPAEISSDRAQVLKEKERKLFGEVTTWKKEAEEKIADYSECSESSPTINDIKNRAKSDNYYELAKCLIQAKSSDGDKAYQSFALGVEDNVLARIRKVPPSNQLQELHEQAEKCLGADDSLTKKLGQLMNKAR